MLTKAEITAASPNLDDVDIQMWLSLIRSNPDYKANVVLFPNLEDTLNDASGDTAGKMLNALSARIQALGIGVVEIRAGDEGLWYNQQKERDALVAYALSILYPVNAAVYPTTIGSFGEYQVRQRSLCHVCGCYAHSSWCRYYG
jgi:hypothetical protein